MSKVRDHIRPRTPAQKPAASRWLLGAVMILTIATGWAFPASGFVVPVVMLITLVVSLRKGRYACGNVCPRGSFFDTYFRPFGGRLTIPAGLRTPSVRWSIFAGLMGFMAFQIARHPGDPLHWGFVFWLACALTTAVAVILGRSWQPRAWCALCPIGTLAAALGKGKHQLVIAPHCTSCGRCEQHCPMELAIAAHRTDGKLPHGDCIKCSSCHAACPQKALQWPDAA